MAKEIGIVKIVTGTVTAVAADGSKRILQAGDRVYPTDMLTTADGSTVMIQLANGSLVDMGGNDSMQLGAALAEQDQPVLAAQNDQPAGQSAEEIQAALLAGADPTTIAEATAAGAPAAGGAVGAGNEGHVPVTVDYLNPVAPVTNGFDTTGPNVAFTPIVPEVLILNPQVVAGGTSVGPLGPGVNVAVTGQSIPEGSIAEFKVDLTGVTAGSILELALANGDADPATADASNSDYNAQTYQYRIGPDGPWLDVPADHKLPLGSSGDFTVYVRVSTVDDRIFEPDETFTLTATLSDGNGTSVSDSAVATILDNDIIANGSTASVSESGLDLLVDGSAPADLAASNVVGSLADQRSETVAGTLDFQGHGLTQVTGVQAGTVDTAIAGNIDTIVNGEFGVLKVAADGSYVYTLTRNAEHTTKGHGIEGEGIVSSGIEGSSSDGIADVFSFTVTDANGTQINNTLTIAINDDVPIARNDTETLKFGEFLSDSVIINFGDSNGNDSAGADGFGTTALRTVTFGNQTQSFESLPINSVLTFETDNGWLDIRSNGHYHYESKANPASVGTVTDQFSYQIQDGDGDYASALLTITQGPNLPNTGDPDQTV